MPSIGLKKLKNICIFEEMHPCISCTHPSDIRHKANLKSPWRPESEIK